MELFYDSAGQMVSPPPMLKKINKENSQKTIVQMHGMDFDVVTSHHHPSICMTFPIHPSPRSPLCGWCGIIQTITGFSSLSLSFLNGISFVEEKNIGGTNLHPSWSALKSWRFWSLAWAGRKTRGKFPWNVKMILKWIQNTSLGQSLLPWWICGIIPHSQQLQDETEATADCMRPG